MYENLGIHWASSIPAFLALACVPFLPIIYRYGPKIRRNCKYAREADEIMTRMVTMNKPGAAQGSKEGQFGIGLKESQVGKEEGLRGRELEVRDSESSQSTTATRLKGEATSRPQS